MWEAATSENEIAPIRGLGVLRPRTWEEYRAWVKEHGTGRVITMLKRPKGLSPNAVYGTTTRILDTNRSWIQERM